MNKFKAGRIPKVIWGLAILVSIFLGSIVYSALSALLWSSNPRIFNDILGISLSGIFLGIIWFFMIKRGKNATIVTEKQLPIPLAVTTNTIKLGILTIVIFSFAILMCIAMFNDTDQSIGLWLLAIFFILIGVLLTIIWIKSINKVILKVDDIGITYQPIGLVKLNIIGPVLWSDITDIRIKVVSSGKSHQSYLQVRVENPYNYRPKKTRPIYDKLSKLNIFSNSDENEVILAPLSLLKIKNDLLLRTCQAEHIKHEHITREKKINESPEQIAANHDISPIEYGDSQSDKKKSKRLANILSVSLIIIILIGAGLAYIRTQTKYVGLKNKTQYFLTESNAKKPDIKFSFKIYDDNRSKYPVILFATELDDDTPLNKENVKQLEDVQNQVIKKGKIYALRQDGTKYASYSKYTIKDKQIKLNLSDAGTGNLILANVDYLKILTIKRVKQQYFTAELQSESGSKKVRIYSEKDLNKAISNKKN